jgi:chromosome segregation ATPase
MTVENNGDRWERQRSSARPDLYRYQEHRREPIDARSWIAIDKTTAMIVGAIASASLAVAVAGGTALVQKVDDTAKDVERGRAERIANFGEMTKNISVVETKLNQLISQLTQLELRIDRSISNESATRDKKLEQIEREVNELRSTLGDLGRDTRRSR